MSRRHLFPGSFLLLVTLSSGCFRRITAEHWKDNRTFHVAHTDGKAGLLACFIEETNAVTCEDQSSAAAAINR